MTTRPGPTPSAPPLPPYAGARPPRARASRFSPLALAAWILFGLLAAVSILGMLSIGIFVAPFALGLLGLLLVKAQPHARAGAPIGVGLLVLWVAWNMRWVSADSCSGAVSSTTPDGAIVTHDPCSHLAIPWGWLAVAAVPLAAGAGFLVRDARAARRHR